MLARTCDFAMYILTAVEQTGLERHSVGNQASPFASSCVGWYHANDLMRPALCNRGYGPQGGICVPSSNIAFYALSVWVSFSPHVSIAWISGPPPFGAVDMTIVQGKCV
eukprot:TRINITY_DN57288_c0_g1_i1.p2 TRINITY_DN57288_c0_g1~~TRINITY_DN57288_c0_g1_i1.p2  ORF type:complete len:109 (-),score=0.81 TRINITY_DN57288_c0_g1_i1:277-603(-)